MRLRPEQFRHSLRALSRNKRFAAMAIVSLGIAIALNTTMYSVIDALVNPKLAMHEPERLILGEYFGDYRRIIPPHEKNDAIRSLTFHSDVAGYQQSWYGNDIVERGSVVRDARVLVVTPNYFGLLGVSPSAGRLVAHGDVDTEPAPVVLSERMWKRLFPERERFDTASILVNGTPRLIVGLLPYEADFPGSYTDVWEVASRKQLAQMPLKLFRLRSGALEAQATAELNTLTLRYAERTGQGPPHHGYNVRPWLQRQFVHWNFHVAMIGAVAAVLLIACANLANLQLARGVSRTKELATRSAVGATRADIVAQLVLESAWLALGGLLLGAILTAWGMHIVTTSVPDTLAEYVTRPQTSWRVVGFSVVATLICLILVGLLPALKLSRVDVSELMKSGAGTGQSRAARRQYGALVVGEVALALALLAGATLLMRAAISLHTEVSQDDKQLVYAFALINSSGPEDRRTLRNWSDLIVNRVRDGKTFVNAATTRNAWPPGRTVSVDDPGGTPFLVRTNMWSYDVVSSDYLRTMKIPVTRGRDFAPGEFAEPVVIVDQFTARELWKGRDPVGQLVKLGAPQSREPWLRVVGVATVPVPTRVRGMSRGDIAQFVATGSALRNVYVLNAADTAALKPPTPTRRSGFLELVARGTDDPRRLALQLRRAVGAMQPNVAAMGVERWDQRGTMRDRVRHDFVASLFAVFAFVALVLAALGVYAVISHTVAQRTREFGVRIAVGADSREIERMVLYDGSVLALLGIAVGLLVTVWSAKFLQAFLFSETDRYDSVLFALVALALFVVAWIASYVPARRATRINPVEALRND